MSQLEKIYRDTLGAKPEIKRALPTQPPEEPSILALITDAMFKSLGEGVGPDGKPYNNYDPSIISPTKPPIKPNTLSTRSSVQNEAIIKHSGSSVEDVSETVGKVLASGFAYLLAPFYAVVDRAVLPLIKKPEELLGPELRNMAKTITAIEQVNARYAIDNAYRDQVNRLVANTLTNFQPQRDINESSPLSDPEQMLVNTVAGRIVQEVLDNLDQKAHCPYCLNSIPSCGCGGGIDLFERALKGQNELVQQEGNSIMFVKLQQLVQTVLGENERQRLLGQLYKSIETPKIKLGNPLEKNATSVILDIPPSALLIGALLGNIDQLPAAINSYLFPTEGGIRGAQLLLIKKPESFGGLTLAIRTSATKNGINEVTKGAQPEWKQPRWQQIASDSRLGKFFLKILGATDIPEIGELSLVNPTGVQDKSTIPLAVKYPREKKPQTGAANVFNLAIGTANQVIELSKEASKLMNVPYPNVPASEDEVFANAALTARKTVLEQGIRPKQVIRQAGEVAKIVLNEKSNQPASLNLLEQEVQKHQVLATELAYALHTFTTTKALLALKEKGFEQQTIYRSTKNWSADQKHEYFKTHGVIPPDKVPEIITLPNSSYLIPTYWTSLQEIAIRSPKVLQLMSKGKIPTDFPGINLSELAAAMHDLDNPTSHAKIKSPLG